MDGVYGFCNVGFDIYREWSSKIIKSAEGFRELNFCNLGACFLKNCSARSCESEQFLSKNLLVANAQQSSVLGCKFDKIAEAFDRVFYVFSEYIADNQKENLKIITQKNDADCACRAKKIKKYHDDLSEIDKTIALNKKQKLLEKRHSFFKTCLFAILKIFDVLSSCLYRDDDDAVFVKLKNYIFA